MRLDTIVAYTYRADFYCPTHVLGAMGYRLPEGNNTVEAMLDWLADARDVDRYVEESFDSGVFPKVVFYSQVRKDDYCGAGHPILEGE